MDLASHVELERLVAGLLQTFEGCSVLLIAGAGNPDVDDEEGLGRIIVGLEAVARVVLLEVEQAACIIRSG